MQLDKGLTIVLFFNMVPQPLFPDTMTFVMKCIKGCLHIYATFLKRRKGLCKRVFRPE